MCDSVQSLIDLGECVLKNETHFDDTPGFAHMSTVTGPQCDEWKKACHIFFEKYDGDESICSKGKKLASVEIMRKSQAKNLLQILKDLQDD